MTRSLCISITLLDPFFHGRADHDKPEWPPSPMRLFQALVAGACAGGRRLPASTEAAFRWLERRDPPLIIAPRAQLTIGHKLFVPNNDGDKRPDRQARLTEKPVRPHRLVEDDPLHYVWDIADSEWSDARTHAETLCQEARRLLALGWGSDMAIANGRILAPTDVLALRGIQWKHWTATSLLTSDASRVPTQDSFSDLARAHKSFLESIDVSRNLYRPPEKPRVFDTFEYRSADCLPRRPCAGFMLESTAGDDRGPAFPQFRIAQIAAMLRSRACQAARDDPHWAAADSEKYVAGHVGDAEESLVRFSYLPLPTVGPHHADGLIRRVLIAEPYGAAGEHSRWAKLRLNHTALIDEQSGKPYAVLAAIGDRDGVFAAYIGDTENWLTVTPVILPGRDDHKYQKAEKLLIQAIVQAGIDFAAVWELSLQKAPFWNRSRHPRDYYVPAHLERFSRWHVRIRFRQPVPGPLAIGTGRHCGLGLFAVGR